ncbi:hypothetical protein QNH20_12885 [Neobacillus sp. WH10]|uniref:imm11 family protein n=1 Tax=Neobacillus sp. WH10 TaxID=3047873 RepID=UPI0024C1B7BA|nr:DUF1629 domain-containing protein [Neobacillus sp. WH10]WHY79976.1 hypothetical protein QNH20_12885 [Neobacillus sp. WH10]
MKIWLLTCQFEKYEVLKFINREDSNLFHENFNGTSMKKNWQPIQVQTYKDGKVSDFPDGLLLVPVFSEKAVQVLQEFILEEKVELLPLTSTKNRKYYAVNVLNVLGAIDGNTSEVRRSRSGRILNYDGFSFFKEMVEGQDIFKVVNHESKRIISTKVFVSDLFRKKVIESGLEGFNFIEFWDSEKTATGEEELANPYLVDTSFGTTYTFEEATNFVMNQNKTVASDKWAMRLDENKELQVGQLQEDGSFLWINSIYYPPIFLAMKWKVL